MTSLNLPVSSLAPDSNSNPVALVAEDGLRLDWDAGRLGGGQCVTGTLKHVKSSVTRAGGIVLRWSIGMTQVAKLIRRPGFDSGLHTYFDFREY